MDELDDENVYQRYFEQSQEVLSSASASEKDSALLRKELEVYLEDMSAKTDSEGMPLIDIPSNFDTGGLFYRDIEYFPCHTYRTC